MKATKKAAADIGNNAARRRGAAVGVGLIEKSQSKKKEREREGEKERETGGREPS